MENFFLQVRRNLNSNVKDNKWQVLHHENFEIKQINCPYDLTFLFTECWLALFFSLNCIFGPIDVF